MDNPTPSLTENDHETGDSIIIPAPVIREQPVAPAITPVTESAGSSRQALIIALVAVFFFAAGMMVDDLLLGGKFVDSKELAADPGQTANQSKWRRQ